MTRPKTVLFGVRLKPDLIQRMRIEAVRTGQRMSIIVTNALEAAVPKHLTITVGRDSAQERRRA